MLIVEKIRSGIEKLSLTVSPDQLVLLKDYVELLKKWNQAYNLTAIRDIDSMISLHVLDSLCISPYITGHYLLDVGSGAGLPGIILAIMHPNRYFTLLDSNGKKTRFLTHVKNVLCLDNVSVENNRCELYNPPELVDVIITRAFGSIKKMVDLTCHLLKSQGLFLAMKGVYPEDELQETFKYPWVSLEMNHSLKIPDCASKRCLVVLRYDKDKHKKYGSVH